MKTIELIDLILKNAKDYRIGANASLKRNAHMNEDIIEKEGNVSQ